MQTFLQEVAEKIYLEFGNKLDKIAIVFPNRRPIHFFKNHLSEIAQKPIWSPDFFTIHELFLNLSGYQLKDNVSLLFELFEHYIAQKKSSETFDEFLQWGEMLLNDFDDIDKFLVNAPDIFQNLSKQKSIENQFQYLTENQINAIKEFWENFNPEPDSDEKKDFVSVWEILAKVYATFTAELHKNKIGYEGLIFRQVAEQIKQSGGFHLTHEKYVFVGFNALNSCEEKLFSWLKNLGKAEFFWDYDLFYTESNNHQGGKFIKKNISDYKSTWQIDSNHIKKHKNITVYNSGTEIAQSLLMKDILKSLHKEGKIKDTNTAVVLSDESILEPVLNELPDELNEINITMGYPITYSSTFSFVKTLLDLQNLYLSRPNSGFYYKSVMELLSHPFIKLIDKDNASELKKFIETNNRFYISDSDLLNFKSLNFLFDTTIKSNFNLSNYLLLCLTNIVENIKIKEVEKQHELEMEFIFQLTKQIKRLDSVLSEQKREINIKNYTRLLLHILKNLSIPFSGEPLKGLQIMGILESRSLDFDNLIILSLNEGILPKRNAAHSYIPANLRYAFGLPLMDHQDSFFSYYFYRLIQRAQNIHLVYFSKSNGFQKGEKSRFIYQLEFNDAFHINNKTVDSAVTIKKNTPIEIEKDDKILSVLNNYMVPGKRTLSPSALNTYIDCSLKFYFKYIAKIKEPDEIKEEVDPLTFGNVLHNAIDEIYTTLDKKEMSASDFESLLANNSFITSTIKKVYFDEFLKTKNENPDLTGQDKIMLEVFNKYVRQIIETDKNYVPLIIISLEDEYKKQIEINIDGKNVKVAIGGKIDRIDRVGNSIRILDYKTGHAETTFTTVNSLFDNENNKRNKAALQTLLYCLLFENSTHHISDALIKPGIYQVKKLFDDNFDYTLNFGEDRKKTKINDYNVVKEQFTHELKNTLTNIFSSKKPFKQTNNSDACKACQYAQICER